MYKHRKEQKGMLVVQGAAPLLHLELPTIFTTGSMLTVQRPRLPFM